MSETLANLRSKLERKFGEIYPLTTGVIDSMADTVTVVDAARTEAEDRWINCWLYIVTPAAERRISDFVSSTGTMTVDTAYAASTYAGDTYYIREKATKQDYEDAINAAIEKGRESFWESKVDETTVIIYDDQLEYALPSDLEYLYRVDIEQTDVVATGTATSADATSLTDTSQSWDTDEWNSVAGSYAIVITDGTGQGQQRTITDTTADTVTVATWTTTPDTTSKYIIKYILEEQLRWMPIRRLWWNKAYAAGTTVNKLHLFEQYTSGMALRIEYAARPTKLASDATYTDVPEQYIINEGMAQLYETLTSKLGEAQDADITRLIGVYRAEAEKVKMSQGHRLPPTRLIEPARTGAGYIDADYPF